MASECARADVAERRRIWINHRQPFMRHQPGRLVFIDETSVNTKMTRLRGRARRGERLKADAPFGRWGTQTFIAGLRCNELTAPWIIPGAIDRTAFDIYIETQLAPTLQRGDVVILDNLSVHKSSYAAVIIRKCQSARKTDPLSASKIDPACAVLAHFEFIPAHIRMR